MKLWTVEIKSVAVIVADSADEAADVAAQEASEILSDDFYPRIEVCGEVRALYDLPDGWNGQCIPYGGDGNSELFELLPNAALCGPSQG